MNSAMLRGLYFWQKNQPLSQAVLVHGGSTNKAVKERMGIVPWTEVVNI